MRERDEALIEARKEIEAARAVLSDAKDAAKAAKDAFEAANDRFLALFDEANELHLFVDSDTGEMVG